jgi:glutathione S-transferase
MLTLYHFTGATCAGKVLISLAEKGIEFEDKLISRADLNTPSYRAMNPAGVVPTLVHDGTVIIESSVILNYLEDAFGGPSLRPDNPKERARMNLWLRWVDDALNSLGTMTYAIAVRFEYLAKSAEERESYYAGIPNPVIREGRRNAIEMGLEAPEVADAMDTMVLLQRRADEVIGNDDYLLSQFSLADVALIPFIHRMEVLGLLASPGQLPNLHRWWKTVKARPSYEQAINARLPAQMMVAMRPVIAASSAKVEELKTRALSRSSQHPRES